MKTTTLFMTLILTAAGMLSAAPAPFPLTVDSQKAKAPDALAFRSSESLYRVTFKDGATASDVTGLTPFMSWSTNATAATTSTSTYSVVTATNGIVDFTFAPAAVNYTPGRYIYEVGVLSGGQTRVYRQGVFTLQGSPYGTGADPIAWTTNMNIALINPTGQWDESNIDDDITRDSEWDTLAEINAATTDEDAIGTSNAVHLAAITNITAGSGITIVTNGRTRTISAPGSAGDITEVVTEGIATGGAVSGIATVSVTEAGIEAVVDLQDLQGAVTDGQVPDDITITETDPEAMELLGAAVSFDLGGFGTEFLDGRYTYSAIYGNLPSWILTPGADASPAVVRYQSGRWYIMEVEAGTTYSTNSWGSWDDVDLMPYDCVFTNSSFGLASNHSVHGLGTASTNATGDFATPAQGALADSAVQAAGDTMTGVLDMGTNTLDGDVMIFDMADGQIQRAASPSTIYIDVLGAAFHGEWGFANLLNASGGLDVTGNLQALTDPTTGNHVGDRGYNDARYLLEANNLSDLDNAGTARSNLGVAIGSDVQAYDADIITDNNGNSLTNLPTVIQHAPIELTSAATVTVSEAWSTNVFSLDMTQNVELAVSNVDTNTHADWILDVRMNSYTLSFGASITNLTNSDNFTRTNSYQSIVGNRPIYETITEVW